jgi:hypothetical protein
MGLSADAKPASTRGVEQQGMRVGDGQMRVSAETFRPVLKRWELTRFRRREVWDEARVRMRLESTGRDWRRRLR